MAIELASSPQVSRTCDWQLEVERGPDWLFVRILPGVSPPDQIAERVWELADRHFIYRLVLEMDEVHFLPSQLMGQLVMLQKRATQHGGGLRLCGLKTECAEALHLCRLDQALPHFESRKSAVVGHPEGRRDNSHAMPNCHLA
jgi:anti-anti-sigma factor